MSYVLFMASLHSRGDEDAWLFGYVRDLRFGELVSRCYIEFQSLADTRVPGMVEPQSRGNEST